MPSKSNITNLAHIKPQRKPINENLSNLILLSNDHLFINTQQNLMAHTLGKQYTVFTKLESLIQPLNKSLHHSNIGLTRVFIYFPKQELHYLLNLFEQLSNSLHASVKDKVNCILVLSRQKEYFLKPDFNPNTLDRLHFTYAPIYADKLKVLLSDFN